MNIFYKLLSTFFLSILFVSCTQKKLEPSFSIKGSISPVNTGFLLLSKEIDIEKKISTVMDTLSVTKEGKFNAEYILDPYLYTLHFNDSTSIALAIDTGQHLTIEVHDLDKKEFKTTITGSTDTEALLAYEAFRIASLDTLVQSVRRRVKVIKESEHPDVAAIVALEKLEVNNYEKHLKELNAFIKKNMGTTLGLYATSIRWKGAENFSFFDSLATAFETAHPNLEITTKLREKVTRLQQTSVGGVATSIKMNSPEGIPISLASVHKKYTLIDFWASWCGPCRSESGMLNNLYKKYHDKGFEIYSISLDSKKDKWIKAIEKDHRIWPNVSSLEAFKTKAAYDYAVTALPMNYLIGSDNKIIGKNLHEDELIALLEKLMN